MSLVTLLAVCVLAGKDGNCPSTRGVSFPGSMPKGHLPNVTTAESCCSSCSGTKGCVTWTLHPSNGCWLHGDYTTNPPIPKPCGDGQACITGTTGAPLPPIQPPPPSPPTPPTPPSPAPPAPVAALATPSEAHLLFHEDNMGAIAHFGMQTFVERTDRACPHTWSPQIFNPSQLDTDQWVAAAASWGAKYFVLVADHFSGFSTWPTTAHNYSVASSPWRGGKGDVVADLIASCKKYGLRPAVYYSVHENWYEDVCSFNLTSAAKQHAFEDMAMLQLTELAEKYGDALAEIWFDAGVKQSLEFVARVDTFVSQKLPSTATCHSCQNMPSVSAVSWMGNENTVMPYPNWNANDDQCSIMGSGGVFGKAGGTRWCPAHCDAVLRRHFWFWDDKQYNGTNDINTAPMLLGMHLTSVGRGCNIVLDMSPTTTGLLQQDDVDVYAAFGKGLSTLYNASLVAETPPSSIARGLSAITIELPATPLEVSRGAIEIRENLTYGQTITNYTVEYCPAAAFAPSNPSVTSAAGCSVGGWKVLPLHNEGQITIGNRRIHYWTSLPSHDAVPAGDERNGGGGAAIRVSVTTLKLASGAETVPHMRSVRVFDWSSASLDPLLVNILQVH